MHSCTHKHTPCHRWPHWQSPSGWCTRMCPPLLGWTLGDKDHKHIFNIYYHRIHDKQSKSAHQFVKPQGSLYREIQTHRHNTHVCVYSVTLTFQGYNYLLCPSCINDHTSAWKSFKNTLLISPELALKITIFKVFLIIKVILRQLSVHPWVHYTQGQLIANSAYLTWCQLAYMHKYRPTK